ncbi:M12 family metallo-peptidase [Dokdonella sp.]|uniref:M12 family metallo-peptidase n=1 Tax=Dokdonella sp. TaxID=2291710 RepID=UPI003C5AAE02
MRLIALSLFMFAATAAMAAETGAVRFDAGSLARLQNLEPGQSVEVAEFPAGPGVLTAIDFKRIEVYAPDARIVVVDDQGEHEIPRSQRIHLIGYSKDGTTRVGLSFDPDLADPPYGAGSSPSGAFEVQSRRIENGWQFSAISAESAVPAGITLEYPTNEDSLPNPNAAPSAFDHLVQDNSPLGALRYAVVAVDTDVSFMSERFSGNTANATAWIATLFAQMNVMYQRDLDVSLLQGTTFLRVATDPYTNTDSPASSAMLAEFGNYWQANYSSGGSAVSRAFAMLLSGNSSSGNSASGIAWVNSYCRTSGNGGSYSTNQIFTNSAISVANTAFIVGHELGHNFGAAHTHCSSATTGSYPTSSNTIDQCNTSGTGCYSGPTSCPASGPGAPKGTLMSYCHVSPSSCGSNVQEFHPTHITQVRTRIAANTPSCLTLTDVLFADGFD